jgi:hypothetical protein
VTRDERLLEITRAVKALTTKAESQMTSAQSLVRVAQTSQLVVQKILERDIQDPAVVRAVVQEFADDAQFQLQPLMEQLAEDSQWWVERPT